MKVSKRILAMLLASGMTVGMMTGCGSSGDSSTGGSASGSASASGDTVKINVILNTLSSEFWSYVQAGAEAYGEEHDNVEVTVVGPTSETAFDEQINMIETALNSGSYDGLVISPLQADAAANVLKGTDMPVVSCANDLECDESLTFVGTGNEKAAEEGAKAAVEAAKEAGWTEITAINIAGVQGNPLHEERTAGFKTGVEESGGTFLEDEIQYADCVADKAVNSMEAIMQTHPEGVAIICCNNDDMALAAARAAKDNAAYENTIFLGFDGISTACQSILDGEETMSIAQDAYGMGYQAVEACVKAIDGEELDEFIDTGCEIISIDNAEEHMNELAGYSK